jgi:hypothetical protein
VVAEDSEEVRMLSVKILEGQGYKVYAAPDGSECLRIVNELNGSVDMLITDVIMPDMNGKSLYMRIAEKYPHTKVLSCPVTPTAPSPRMESWKKGPPTSRNLFRLPVWLGKFERCLTADKLLSVGTEQSPFSRAGCVKLQENFNHLVGQFRM